MIPSFPKFKKLHLDDKKEIEQITREHHPYSDYNFVSLWSWDTDEKAEISYLNGNLVLKFQDYMTYQPFFSFIGKEKIVQTIDRLFSHINQQDKKQVFQGLKLIPECIIQENKLSKSYDIEEDRDNFDYILSVEDLKLMKGSAFNPKRNFINRFIRFYGGREKISPIVMTDPSTHNDINDLFLVWEKGRKKERKETENELKAINKLLKSSHAFTLVSIGLFIDNKLVGFSINELVHNNHGVIHFEKADVAYIGIFEYLKQQTAIFLHQHGCKYINYEQDLGIEGLRRAKQSYRPVHYLKKYIIKKK